MDRADPKPVLFFAFANDRDDRVSYLRNLPVEAAGVRNALDKGTADGLWDVVERRNATLEEILDVFQDVRYRGRIVAFHFAGHAGSYELMLETASGASDAADAAVFSAFLRQQHGLRLVFLNGCSTQGHVDGLLAAGLPAVIATSRAIDDGVATRFAIRFYQGLAGGAGIRAAYDEAAAAQQPGRGSTLRDLYRVDEVAADERWPWDLHIRDGAETVSEWSLADAAGHPLLGLPPLPAIDLPPKPYRHLNWFTRDHAPVFFGRGRAIRDLFERLASAHTPPITLLYGRSGVGKSSLLAAGLLPRLESVCATRYIRRDHELGLRGSLRRALGMGPEHDSAGRVEGCRRFGTAAAHRRPGPGRGGVHQSGSG